MIFIFYNFLYIENQDNMVVGIIDITPRIRYFIMLLDMEN